jgi:ZIP family zinc transporter
MTIAILAIITFFSTFLGGIFSIKHQDRLHRIMGFSAGILLGVVFFDIFPEIIELIKQGNYDVTGPMLAITLGFMLFHTLEKSILIHHSHEEEYAVHKHPHVGIASAVALAGHSFMDGVGIGLAFQINTSIGILVAVAVITHDFTDGMNTVGLILTNNNSVKRAIKFLILDALTPALGIIFSSFFNFPEKFLLWYLGFFAGFLLYISASDVLPEAHSKHSSWKTIALTFLGIALIFSITRFLGI